MAARKPRRQGEGQLSDAIRETLAFEPGLLLFRNSQAAMRKGSRVYKGGLGNGSADLVGVLAVEACGELLGRFVALEVKIPGEKCTDGQVAWLESVRARGGFAAVVRSVEEARDAVKRARGGARS